MAVLMGLTGCGKAPDGQGAASVAPDDGTRPLVLIVMPELPPYAYLDEASGEIKGVDIDIVRAAAERLGRRLEVRQTPFSELLPILRQGGADFAVGAITITEGRRHDADFSDPYAVEGAAFIYNVGDPEPTMVRAEALRVGAVESMTHDFYLTRHGIDPFRYKTIEEAVADLVARRIDTVFYDRPALVAAVEQSGGTLAVTPLETRENYGIAVRKGHPALLEAVNAVIRERNAK